MEAPSVARCFASRATSLIAARRGRKLAVRPFFSFPVRSTGDVPSDPEFHSGERGGGGSARRWRTERNKKNAPGKSFPGAHHLSNHKYETDFTARAPLNCRSSVR